ncbi:methyl-accepting chemotaxis protein [Paraburkholderia terrae]|uniref:methyl-accepting chemotaxis protein n=1 Tax=Paraburkholderia TaxID=1822464 RepID=UPI00207EA966|nr:methyl-accepting chemotaxis protein [Paraburkholderia terrae]BEU21178.1 methyl-accepting chemotaxis protein [Paraburkholderia sp. 22B1P]GJH07077.1 methyl-accepting chemotaxis protein [Paraburkholderia terrae]GJH39410.1 methyl-accepting chemotaxis protein [Paraburkholderia hospita]
MKNGITIKAKIGLTVALLASLLVITGALGLIGVSRSNDELLDVYTNQMASAVDIGNAERALLRERLALDRAAFEAGTPAASTALTRAQSLRPISDQWWKRYLDLPRDADEDRHAQEVGSKREALFQVMNTFSAMIASNEQEKFAEGEQRVQGAFNDLSTADDALSAIQFDQARGSFDSAQSRYTTFRRVGLIALIIGLSAALISYLHLRAAIARPLGEALRHFDAIAEGDLRRAIIVRSSDEMGQLMHGVAKMQRSLIEMVQTVRIGSESIATATRQIAAGNVDLSSRTEEQASALEETASSMEELTDTVKQNANNARQASTLAVNASEIAERGSAVVTRMVGTMGEINHSSGQIADITAIIKGIAFQTNILALNAAVEAARAGEEGRGFAVVAGEVRSLAQRSAAAAKEIKELIDTSLQRVQAGSALVDEVGRTMSHIAGAIRRVTDITSEIATASDEQSSGIDQVARAVTQMDEATQQNAALVEEAAAAASALEEQAARLRAACSRFRVYELEERANDQMAITA